MAFDWDSHRKHRDQVKNDAGQWVGLLDEDWQPIMDIPPIVDMAASSAANAQGALKLVVSTRTSLGIVSPIVDELVADNLAAIDKEGRLTPAFTRNRFIAVERAGLARRVFRITHVVARGMEAPTTLEIHGVDEMDVWASIPCPSSPSTWQPNYKKVSQDWAQVWEQSYLMAEVKMAAVADGFTVAGPAEETIRRLARESLTAFFRIAAITDNPVVVEEKPTGVDSPQVLIQPKDDSLLETVGDIASAAGVELSCRLWWPGDPPIIGHEDNQQPCYVLGVKQRKAA